MWTWEIRQFCHLLAWLHWWLSEGKIQNTIFFQGHFLALKIPIKTVQIETLPILYICTIFGHRYVASPVAGASLPWLFVKLWGRRSCIVEVAVWAAFGFIWDRNILKDSVWRCWGWGLGCLTWEAKGTSCHVGFPTALLERGPFSHKP